jgi:hypothetical protein
MRKLVAAGALALAFAAPAASAAEPFLDARIGFGLPFGEIVAGTDLRDVVSSDVPLQVDAGFRFGRALSVAGYVSYGFGQLADDADRACGSADCSARIFRIGLQAAIHSGIGSSRDVWGGVLFGWERLALDAPTDLTASGPELGILGGLDFTGDGTGFGPYVSLTFGEFSSLEQGGRDVDVGDEKVHGTLLLGVRGYFGL